MVKRNELTVVAGDTRVALGLGLGGPLVRGGREVLLIARAYARVYLPDVCGGRARELSV